MHANKVRQRRPGAPPNYPRYPTQAEGDVVGIASWSRYETDLGGVLPMLFVSLKAGEMTTLDEGGYDPSVHLSYKDIAIDDRWQPSLIRVSIRCMRILHYFFTTAPVNLQTLNTSVNSVQLSLWGTASLLEQGQSTILL